MALSREMRTLMKKWESGTGWPKRLEWLKITGIRGFEGQPVEFQFPITAIVGENGSGKSTILQSAAIVHQNENEPLYFPTDFIPNTFWDKFQNASIDFGYREYQKINTGLVRKLKERWRGYETRPIRYVEYQDLSRVQPFATKVGYARLADGKQELDKISFDDELRKTFCHIMGKNYEFVGSAITEIDDKRRIPIHKVEDNIMSGFHHGMGEITVQAILGMEFRKYELLLVDEIETSLHPRAQRKLIRELASLATKLEIQIILTTHSPYILSELPENARLYIMREGSDKVIMRGVSPEFAMTKMDDEQYPDCDIYVEDSRAETLLKEILIEHTKHAARCRFIPFGGANVGIALGQMVDKFPKKSFVYLDGDQWIVTAPGCYFLPGEEAPERVVFEGLSKKQWRGVAERLGREFPDVTDALEQAKNGPTHREWIRTAAIKLSVGTDQLWQALCSCWAKYCLEKTAAQKVAQPISDFLGTIAVFAIEQQPLPLQFVSDDQS